MTPESVFQAANMLTLAAWVLLATRPRAAMVQRLAGTVAPVMLAVTYSVLAALFIGRGTGDFNSLAGVSALFANPWLLLAGWIHYLAFDLLTGVWEVRDAARRGVPHWLVLPCLVLTFLLGPAGWLLYQAVRRSRPEPAAAPGLIRTL
jgi:hypothetical protein